MWGFFMLSLVEAWLASIGFCLVLKLLKSKTRQNLSSGGGWEKKLQKTLKKIWLIHIDCIILH
jgi:hypothetical protein